MQAFGEFVPAVEKYSIDECFLDLTGIPQDLTSFGRVPGRGVGVVGASVSCG